MTIESKPSNPTAGAPVSFDDTAVAFGRKSDRELLLSYLIFSLTKSPLLVKLFSQAARICLKLHLPIKPIIKSTVFKQFCGGESSREYTRIISGLGQASVGAILDYSVEGNKDENGFEQTKDELLAVIRQAAINPDIPCACMKLSAIGDVDLFAKVSAGASLSPEEQRAWDAVGARLDSLCAAARDAGKPLYIDAEETWVQDAMDDLAERMMARYNTGKAVVYTTLQLYRWDRIDYFSKLIGRAGSGGYKVGVKLVRGAYMEKERERARRKGYPSPINPTKEATDDTFDRAVAMSVDNIDAVELCLGTHNEKSCRLLMQHMAQRNIPNDHPHIWFSQLYGMSDNISFNLAKAGYRVSKYLPYGPVEATLPYLTRRAEENTAIAGQMSKELDIIVKERNRRRSAGFNAPAKSGSRLSQRPA